MHAPIHAHDTHSGVGGLCRYKSVPSLKEDYIGYADFSISRFNQQFTRCVHSTSRYNRQR